MAALRRYLATVQKEIADRDRQLVELASREVHASAAGDMNAGAERTNEIDEWLKKGEKQVQSLEAQLAEADLRIQENEERLRQDGLRRNSDVGEAPSVASTTLTGPLSSEQWQERAKALEREIRSESAQALELQDRIHWLRNQLARQPSSKEGRVVAIQDLFEQIQNKLDELNGTSGNVVV
jgi:chromosome segregation ATPase